MFSTWKTLTGKVENTGLVQLDYTEKDWVDLRVEVEKSSNIDVHQFDTLYPHEIVKDFGNFYQLRSEYDVVDLLLYFHFHDLKKNVKLIKVQICTSCVIFW